MSFPQVEAHVLQVIADGDGDRGAEEEADEDANEDQAHAIAREVPAGCLVDDRVVVGPNVLGGNEVVCPLCRLQQGFDQRRRGELVEAWAAGGSGLHQPVEHHVEVQHRVERGFEVLQQRGHGVHVGTSQVVLGGVLQHAVDVDSLGHHIPKVHATSSHLQVLIDIETNAGDQQSNIEDHGCTQRGEQDEDHHHRRQAFHHTSHPRVVQQLGPVPNVAVDAEEHYHGQQHHKGGQNRVVDDHDAIVVHCALASGKQDHHGVQRVSNGLENHIDLRELVHEGLRQHLDQARDQRVVAAGVWGKIQALVVGPLCLHQFICEVLEVSHGLLEPIEPLLDSVNVPPGLLEANDLQHAEEQETYCREHDDALSRCWQPFALVPPREV
mmetsp:Transcript_30230/g.72113  ORF Transcript_30230/g.72113 Transcript_30230/m.72113 type:complete len:382 (-) Transcript_30230:328-1473(-)